MQVETPVPPVLREEHLGKETPAGAFCAMLVFLSCPPRITIDSFEIWGLESGVNSWTAAFERRRKSRVVLGPGTND